MRNVERQIHGYCWNPRTSTGEIDRDERKNWAVDVTMTTSASSRWDKPKEREKDPRGGDSSFQQTRRHFLPSLTSFTHLFAFPFPFPLPFFRSTETFLRRLITPWRSSYKTLFNLQQRDRVYYTCWCGSSTDAFPFCFSLSFSVSPYFYLFSFLSFCEDTKGWKTPWQDSAREFLLILCNATLINSRRCSDVRG